MTVQRQTVGRFVYRPTKTRSRHVRDFWEQEGLHPSRLELVCKHVCSHTPRYVSSGCGMIAVDLTAALLPVRTAHVQAATSQGTLTSCQAIAVIEICNHNLQFTTSWFLQGVSTIQVADCLPIPGPTSLPT